MATFIETPRFPDEIAYWAIGGRGFKTTVVEAYGGDEYRVAAWSQARGVWDISQALRNANLNSAYSIPKLRNFFRVCKGQLYAFRFKDFSDYTDEGGGVFVMLTSTTFQMYKQYAISPLADTQIIQKPVSATVVVTGGSGASVDYTTGIVTVSSGTPTSWTGQFDIPVRFAEDMPQLGPDSSGALYDWQNLKLIEVRNPG